MTITSIETEGHTLQMLKLATCKEAAAIHQQQQFTITIRAVSVKQFRVYFSIHPQEHFQLCAGKKKTEDDELFFILGHLFCKNLTLFSILPLIRVFNDAKFGNILVMERCNFGLAANQLFYLENVNNREEFADFQKKKRAGKMWSLMARFSLVVILVIFFSHNCFYFFSQKSLLARRFCSRHQSACHNNFTRVQATF